MRQISSFIKLLVAGFVAQAKAMLRACEKMNKSQVLRIYCNYFNIPSFGFNAVAFIKITNQDKYQQIQQEYCPTLQILSLNTKYKLLI